MQVNDDARIEALLQEELNEPDHAEYALLTEYFAGDLSEDDRRQVEERLRTDPKFRALADSLEPLWTLPGSLRRKPTLVEQVAAERTWQDLKKRIELAEHGIPTPTLSERRAKRRRNRSWIFTFIGALVSGWLGAQLRPQLFPAPAVYVHADAPLFQERSATLPDETEVTLRPGSHLSYLWLFSSSGERTLTLDGEGTFTIAPGPRKALVVSGANVEVRAAEGRFWVEARDAAPYAYVSVYQGRAEVQARTLFGYGQSLTLRAGESAQVGPGLYVERIAAPIGARQRTSMEPRETGKGTANASVVASAAATPPRPVTHSIIVTQRTDFVRWPRELASRAPALADGIERDFGERPRTMTFTGRDLIEVSFWNPRFWANEMQSKEFPQESLPLVRKAANRVAGYVWTTFGHDAGINFIRIAFTRVRKENVVGFTKDVPAQEAFATFTRSMLEPGPPDVKAIGVSQRDDAPIPAHPTTIDSAGATAAHEIPPDGVVRGPRALADRGLALLDTIGRDFGQRPHELSFTGKDTIDVTFWNPTFWPKHVPPEEFQKALLPLARKAAEQVGGVVWTNYGRDAGINVIRVTFVRMRKESSAHVTRDVPAEELTGLLARKPLENGPPRLVSVSVIQR
jgi:hypothetical protein